MDKFTNSASSIGKSLVSLANSVKVFIPTCERLMKKIFDILNHLDELEADVENLRDALKDCRGLLSETCNKANTLMQRFKKLLVFGDLNSDRGRKGRILKKTERGDMSALNAYLKQLGKLMKQCDQCYQTFRESKVKFGNEAGRLKDDAERRRYSAYQSEVIAGGVSYVISGFGASVRDGYITWAIAYAASVFSKDFEGDRP